MLRALIAAVALAASALAQVETTPPPPAAPRPVRVPRAIEQILPNGLRVIVIPKHNVPIIAARLMIRTGGAADPGERAGLADMTASLLTKGTTTHSARQIAEGVESLGATIDGGAGWDGSFVATSAMSSKLPEALAYVAEVARHPAFTAKELKRQRTQNLDALQVNLREPRTLRNMVTTRVLFGTTPYGHPLGGTRESLKRITRQDVVAFHRRYYRPANAILVFGGDIEPQAAFELAKKLFGSWPNGGKATFAQPPVAPLQPKARVVVIDMPEAGQAAVAVARFGIRRGDPHYDVSEVTNMVLGGGYSSRLNEEIRIKRGLSYGAGSYFDSRRNDGPFVASALTKNESAVEVAGLLLDELARISREPVPEAEMAARKANLIGTFSRSLETNAALVGRVGELALFGLPLDEVGRYTGAIEHVTVEEVRSFAAGHFGGGLNVVIVGNAKSFGDALTKRFPDAQVIPADQLDLDGAALRRARPRRAEPR
jgi:zinc protease